MIASILSRVAEVANQFPGSDGQASDTISREVAGLMAITELHFAYEERVIGAALDGRISDTSWSDMVFRFRDGPHRRGCGSTPTV